jgi:DNA transposition AAA+ family ATPase
MARHFLDLPQARTLPTESLLMVAHAVEDVLGTGAMGVVHGPAGLGKTFAVEEALARAPGVVACWSAFPSRPTMRLVAASLVEQLTGVAAGRRDRFTLTRLLVEELAIGPGVVVIDEAQRLNRECIEFLRYLHDHPQTRFALLLVGGDGTWGVLSREPMLCSRIYRRVSFTPLSGPAVCELMGSFHPIYAGVGEELLLFIDDHFAHGNLRDWAAFTATAAGLCTKLGRDRVDEQIARNAFAVHGGGGGGGGGAS